MTHTVIMAERKSSKAVSAIQLQDKAAKWAVLQEYLKKYGPFIADTAPFTGLCVYPVDMEFYNRIELHEIDQQLRIVIGIVYFKDALYSAGKETFKEYLKKLIKQSGLLTDEQLRLL